MRAPRDFGDAWAGVGWSGGSRRAQPRCGDLVSRWYVGGAGVWSSVAYGISIRILLSAGHVAGVTVSVSHSPGTDRLMCHTSSPYVVGLMQAEKPCAQHTDFGLTGSVHYSILSYLLGSVACR